MSMIHEITSSVPRNKRSQRKGRGRSSNRGKTSGRGGKGSSARQGGPHWVPGHEGGQTKIFMRFPKRGFSNDDFERRFYIVNVADLEKFDNGATVDSAALVGAGLVPDDKLPVKVLGDGTLSKKLTVSVGWFSKSAHEKITKAGGAAQNLKGEAFEFPKPKKRFVPREKDASSRKKKAADEPAEGEAKAEAKPEVKPDPKPEVKDAPAAE